MSSGTFVNREQTLLPNKLFFALVQLQLLEHLLRVCQLENSYIRTTSDNFRKNFVLVVKESAGSFELELTRVGYLAHHPALHSYKKRNVRRDSFRVAKYDCHS